MGKKKKELGLGKGVSTYLAYKLAQDFYKTADMIYEQQLYKPVIVNLALACELYIKALLMLQQECSTVIEEHRLNILFGDLDGAIQTKIIQDAGIANWDEFITDSANAFVKWRYYYEQDKSMIGHISGLFKFADVLDKICNEKIKIKGAE